MGTGHGYGKVILFNEHFVVYDVPAIASAIDRKTVATVERCAENKDYILHDNRPATPGYKQEKMAHQKDSIRRILAAMNIDECVEITLDGNLKAASGVGASAASCTAIARALSDEFALRMNEDEINAVAYEGEKGYHGDPSGIDNTCATFGGLVWFTKTEGMRRLTLKRPVEIVMGNTGVVADTKKAVAGVRERREKNRTLYDALCSRARLLAHEAREALTAADWPTVGKLMDMNHTLLQEIGVSSEELDTLVEVARRTGASGAKMTGGGLGGYMVALTPGTRVQKAVATATEAEGYETLQTRIGVAP
jgi:mevalonate kinase